MPLLDRYLIQIWEQSGGCAPRLVPFSEVRDLVYEDDDSDLSELIGYVGDYSNPKGTDIATDLVKVWDDVYPKSEPDGSSLEERMDAVDQQLFETQGMADKFAAIELRKDEIFEILENKNIVNPQINETPVRAYFDIALAEPATKRIRISAITPGTAANSYTYDVTTVADPEDMNILWESPKLDIMVQKDDGDNITTTAYELARLAADTRAFVSNFIISFDDGTPITEDGDGAGVIAAYDAGLFANGSGADHVLTSTGTQIDAAVAVAPEYVDTFATATAAKAILTSDTTAVTNGSEVTVNDVTYTFVTALTTDPATVSNEVLIGADSDESLTNLMLAINGEATEGTNYSILTDTPADVTATVDTDANTLTVTATTKGVGGNAYPKASDDEHLTWDATDPADKFSGGVDGQVGATGKIVFTASAVYCCTNGTKCVITDSSGWKTVAFS